MANATAGFLAASKSTKTHAETLDSELKVYAMNPDLFKGPQADEFRRLYNAIAGDLAVVVKTTSTMSTLVETANSSYLKVANAGASELSGGAPGSSSGGGNGIFSGITGHH